MQTKPIYATMTINRLMLVSAEINEEWRKRTALNQEADTAISEALFVQSPGQLQVKIAELERTIAALRDELHQFHKNQV